MDIEPSQSQPLMAMEDIKKMADSGYCYDAYLLYWRGMQVDGEIIFSNKGPIGLMVKDSEHFQNGQLPGQYIAIKVT